MWPPLALALSSPQGSVRELQLVSLLPGGQLADVGVALEGERGLDLTGLTDRLVFTSQVSAPGRVLTRLVSLPLLYLHLAVLPP